MKKSYLIVLSVVFALSACRDGRKNGQRDMDFVARTFAVAKEQYAHMLRQQTDLSVFPRTLDGDGNVVGTDEWDWTGGFFPGALWYVYEYTQDETFRRAATRWTEALEKAKDLTQHHDIGFVMYCSYGNALRLEKDPSKLAEYRNLMLHAAESALKRYDPQVGLIKSWNEKASWDGKTVWRYPVIIDNMMNLELLFYASRVSGDPKYAEAAISHADRTMENHFRPDYSTYHVVDYDPLSGAAVHRQTNQGYADNSTWARGQAWAIYGYTLMYRETRVPKYLETAQKAADFFMDHPNLPEDGVPYWDFDAGRAGYVSDVDFSSRELDYVPRDASAAALVASALLELSAYVSAEMSERYFGFAEALLQALSSEEYLADPGTNGGFVLKHSVGSLPHGNEVDVPLIYADYYFLEALLRYEGLKTPRTRP